MPTARHAHFTALCCVGVLHVHIVCYTVSAALFTCRRSIECSEIVLSERTTLHQCNGSHMAISRTASVRLNDGSNPPRGARRTSSRNLAPLSPAQNQSGRLACTVPPTSCEAHDNKWNLTSDIDGLAVVASKPEECLMSDVSDAPHHPRSDDNDETQLAGGDPKQRRSAKRDRVSERSRS